MKPNRRQFFRSTAGLAAAAVPAAMSSNAAEASPGKPDWAAVREDFPWLKRKLWISGADYHPLGVHSLKAVQNYYAWRVHGPSEGSRYTSEQQRETKEMFAKLIHAKPNEIAFAASTTDGENLVVAGMDLARKKGNVVLDDLHYQASKYLYHMLEKEGNIELRVVRHRGEGDWRIDPKDMAKAIDRNTKLVSIALVSNINGYLHDARATSEAAHAHGAYVYADIIQGAGAIPIDIHALGIDFACCGTYKWLMGDMGIAFLYVREDLQGSVVKRTRYGTRQFSSPNRAQADSQFDLRPGAVQYETSSTLPNAAGVCAHASLRYIHKLGIGNIRAHVKPLTDRLQKELPRMGYPSVTPPDNPTPIVSFLLPEPEKAAAKLEKAFGYMVIALKRWEFTDAQGKVRIVQGMRISPSVYNNDNDIDRLLNALS